VHTGLLNISREKIVIGCKNFVQYFSIKICPRKVLLQLAIKLGSLFENLQKRLFFRCFIAIRLIMFGFAARLL